jgi:uncharacterized protein (TIGR03546 family)
LTTRRRVLKMDRGNGEGDATLPTPIAWTKKILKILKSNLSPSQIAFGFAMGIFAGLPPMGLHIVVPCTLALLVRCSFRSFLLSMGLFKLISLGVAPAAFAIGTWCLDSSRGVDALWRWLFHLPVLAPMGYGRYLLFGSLIAALLTAVPVFLLIRWLVAHYRGSFAGWVAGWRVSAYLRGKRGVGLARRFLAGGEAKYAVKPPPRGPLRYIRKEMLIGLPIVYAACYLLAAVIVPLFAGTIATSTASWVVGSEVAVRESAFSLFTGALTLDGLVVQDPNAPDENLLEVPRLTLDAGMIPLLSKRVVFDNIIVANASVHVKREVDGTLNVDNATSGWNVDGYLNWAAENAKRVDWLGLLRTLLQHLEDVRPLAPRDDPYAPHRGGRSFGGSRPPFSIERIEIGRILITLEDDLEPTEAGPLPPITLLEVELSNLAFPAHLRSGPIFVRLHGQWGDDPESGFELSARFDLLTRAYDFSVTQLDLPRLARFYATTLPVRIESGKATLTGHLSQHGGVASGEVSFLLEDLRLQGDPQRPLFGLPAETADRVVAGINRYGEELPIVFGSRIGGSADGPKLEWEVALLDIAREGLLIAGRREFKPTIERLGLRIDELGGANGIPLAPGYAALRAETTNAARRIIETTASDLLEDLLLPSTRLESAPSDEPAHLLPDLLERLFRSQQDAPDGDGGETEPE